MNEAARYHELARAYPPLAADEERDLARRARAGDAGALEKLIRHHLRLVVGVISKLKLGAVQYDDVFQEGCLGLDRAARKYDPDTGYRFSTYAVWWIRAYTVKFLKEARSSVKPRAGTVAVQDASLDAPMSDAGEESFLDNVADDRAGPEDHLARTGHAEAIRSAVSRLKLSPLGHDIVRRRLASDDPATLEEIATPHGVSRERVRQVEMRTLDTLRRYLTAQGLGEEDRETAALLAARAAPVRVLPAGEEEPGEDTAAAAPPPALHVVEDEEEVPVAPADPIPALSAGRAEVAAGLLDFIAAFRWQREPVRGPDAERIALCSDANLIAALRLLGADGARTPAHLAPVNQPASPAKETPMACNECGNPGRHKADCSRNPEKRNVVVPVTRKPPPPKALPAATVTAPGPVAPEAVAGAVERSVGDEAPAVAKPVPIDEQIKRLPVEKLLVLRTAVDTELRQRHEAAKAELAKLAEAIGAAA